MTSAPNHPAAIVMIGQRAGITAVKDTADEVIVTTAGATSPRATNQVRVIVIAVA